MRVLAHILKAVAVRTSLSTVRVLAHIFAMLRSPLPLRGQLLTLSDDQAQQRLAGLGRAQRPAALAVAFVLGMQAERWAEVGGRDPRDFTTDTQHLLEETGLARTAGTAALQRLHRYSLLRSLSPVRPADTLFEERLGSRPDAGAILARIGGETAPLVICRAHIAQPGNRPEQWLSLPHDQIAAWTGYTSATVRRGRRRLVEAGLLDEQAYPGSASRYRFTPVAWGEPEPEPEPRQTPAPADHTRSSTSASSAHTVHIGDLCVQVDPGVPVRVTTEPEGLIYWIGEMRIGPIPR